MPDFDPSVLTKAPTSLNPSSLSTLNTKGSLSNGTGDKANGALGGVSGGAVGSTTAGGLGGTATGEKKKEKSSNTITPRIDLQPTYRALQEAVGSENWATYKEAVGGFISGKFYICRERLMTRVKHRVSV
jgi:hypothetical protein